MTLRVLLAEDHHVVREGLRRLLDDEPDIDVVGEAADGLEAVRLCESLRPDVLVTDLMMPGLNAIEVAREVAEKRIDTRVVVLSMYSDEAYVVRALRSGASAYVLKESRGAEVVEAVRAAARGHRYLGCRLAERAIDRYLDSLADEYADPLRELTDRERQVLRMVAEGRTNREIGDVLAISPRTVEIHRGNAMNKLGLRRTASLVRYAVSRGLLDPARPEGPDPLTLGPEPPAGGHLP